MAYLGALHAGTIKLNLRLCIRQSRLKRAIINLGHTLRLTVIAEGVESEAHVRLLRKDGCDQAQGYHFAGALPASDIELLLRRTTRADLTRG